MKYKPTHRPRTDEEFIKDSRFDSVQIFKRILKQHYGYGKKNSFPIEDFRSINEIKELLSECENGMFVNSFKMTEILERYKEDNKQAKYMEDKRNKRIKETRANRKMTRDILGACSNYKIPLSMITGTIGIHHHQDFNNVTFGNNNNNNDVNTHMSYKCFVDCFVITNLFFDKHYRLTSVLFEPVPNYNPNHPRVAVTSPLLDNVYHLPIAYPEEIALWRINEWERIKKETTSNKMRIQSSYLNPIESSDIVLKNCYNFDTVLDGYSEKESVANMFVGCLDIYFYDDTKIQLQVPNTRRIKAVKAYSSKSLSQKFELANLLLMLNKSNVFISKDLQDDFRDFYADLVIQDQEEFIKNDWSNFLNFSVENNNNNLQQLKLIELQRQQWGRLR